MTVGVIHHRNREDIPLIHKKVILPMTIPLITMEGIRLNILLMNRHIPLILIHHSLNQAMIPLEDIMEVLLIMTILELASLPDTVKIMVMVTLVVEVTAAVSTLVEDMIAIGMAIINKESGFNKCIYCDYALLWERVMKEIQGNETAGFNEMKMYL